MDISALLIVDLQNDFCEGGSLAVDGGDRVAEKIAHHDRPYNFVAVTKDWHIDPGDHFSDDPNFTDTWPPHCVAATDGAKLHEALVQVLQPSWAIFHKGMWSSAYSGFEGICYDEDDPLLFVTLEQFLRRRNVNLVDVCGLALDFCVKATAFDAVKAGFETRLLYELTAAVHKGETTKCLKEYEDAGIEVVTPVQ